MCCPCIDAFQRRLIEQQQRMLTNLALPNTPDAYEVADAKLFEEVFPWAERLVARQSKNGDSLGRPAGGKSPGLEFGKPVKAGPYTIQPVIPVDAMALREGKQSLPIAGEEQELNVSITVTWAIDNRNIGSHFELAK
jgi:hypothetical protein